MMNRCSRQTSVLSFLIVAAGLVLVLWPVAGYSQRTSRRDASSPSGSTTSAADGPVDPNATGSGNQWASYDIILKRNIFSRTRVSARRQVREEPRVVVRPNPEAYYLLKGVVQENDEFIAFIEDTQGGTVLRLHRGDSVARGVIKTLTLDGLEYEMEDKTVVVRLGLDLEGGRGAAMAGQMYDLAASTSTSAGPPAQTRPATPATGAEADILRRLMEQRKQQLGQ